MPTQSSRELPHLLVRADADERIGIGHVMRSLALAEAWSARGGAVTFVSCGLDSMLRDRIEKAGCRYEPIPAPYPDSGDLGRMVMLAAQCNRGTSTARVVLDGYVFDEEYQSGVRKLGYQLMVIDDIGHLPRYDADFILNPSLKAGEVSYRAATESLFLLGPRYALLRSEFRRWNAIRRTSPRIARKILVTLGGSDYDNVTRKVLDALALSKLTDPEIKVLVGPTNAHAAELTDFVSSISPRVTLETNVSDPCELMQWADLAIAAGGMTAWELVYMRVPALLLLLAENQTGSASGLAELCAVRSLGFAHKLSSREIANAITDLAHDQPTRASMVETGHSVIDGYGTERAIEAILYKGDPLRLRPAAVEDALLLWQWANDPDTRKNSFDSQPVCWSSHCEWYRTKLAWRDARIWIMELRGVPVGQIRYERTDDGTAEISFSVARAYRGRGLGRKLLNLSSRRAKRELRVKRIEGITFIENLASARSFQRAGFELAEQKTISGHVCLIFRSSSDASSDK